MSEDFYEYIIEKLGDPGIPNIEALEDMWSLFDKDTHSYGVETLGEIVKLYRT